MCFLLLVPLQMMMTVQFGVQSSLASGCIIAVLPSFREPFLSGLFLHQIISACIYVLRGRSPSRSVEQIATRQSNKKKIAVRR